MAIGIINMPNTAPPDSDYLGGRIKDDTGINDGTPINVQTNGDIQEFLSKLMTLAGITPNGLPDNEYTGHQLIDALKAFDSVTHNDAGICATGNFEVTLTTTGLTATIPNNSIYKVIKRGKEIKLYVYVKVVVSAVGAGNRFFNFQITPPNYAKGLVGSFAVGTLSVSPAIGSLISNVIGIDGVGNLGTGYDNTTITFNVGTYEFELSYTYRAQNAI